MSESSEKWSLSVAAWLRRARDPWSSVPAPVPASMFGAASRRPFGWYLEGECHVPVKSVTDIELWLLGCTYVSDRSSLGEDRWLHPSRFEAIRMGDCGDHAIWAWRRLIDLGKPASLVVGRWLIERRDAHVWVLLDHDDDSHLFESTSKSPGEALHKVSAVRSEYRPFFSVNEKGVTRAYAGAAQDVIESPFG